MIWSSNKTILTSSTSSKCCSFNVCAPVLMSSCVLFWKIAVRGPWSIFPRSIAIFCCYAGLWTPHSIPPCGRWNTARMGIEPGRIHSRVSFVSSYWRPSGWWSRLFWAVSRFPSVSGCSSDIRRFGAALICLSNGSDFCPLCCCHETEVSFRFNS